MNIPKSFGIWGNTAKDSFWDLIPDILSWANEKKLSAYVTRKVLNDKGNRYFDLPIIKSQDDFNNLDFMLSLGGDGTFLALARAIEHRKTPILGIHLGDLGFLAKVTKNDLFSRLNQVIKGEFILEKRMILNASIRKDKSTKNYFGLNDFVLSNGDSHRMLSVRVHINKHLVSEYRADGLIIATPTGSTAYSLSAGGPIVVPEMDSMILTPSSAHTLTSRPLVISPKSKIILSFPKTNESILFIADGQIHESMEPSSKVEITRADYDINLIDFEDSDYFETLRTKMGWGTRGIE